MTYLAGDTFPLGCAFDESNIHHKVINLFQNHDNGTNFYLNLSKGLHFIPALVFQGQP